MDFLMGNQYQVKEREREKETENRRKKNILLEMLLATVYDNAIRDWNQ